MQTASAFGYVRESLSWFINVYPSFAEWKATVDRLIGLHHAIEAAKRGTAEESRRRAGERTRGLAEAGSIGAGSAHRRDAGLGRESGNSPRVAGLIQGPSGSGKSTLFRAIAGIWPFGQGRILQPANFDRLFLPQRPYFPLGTLREAVCYPARSEAFTDARDRRGAHRCRSAASARRDWMQSADWSTQLSGGEQQRVAFARALLEKPAWLFLDEATSSLDDASQAQLYELLTERLTHTTIVSIAHRNDLARFHGQRLGVAPGGEHGVELGPQAV